MFINYFYAEALLIKQHNPAPNSQEESHDRILQLF